MFFIELLLDLQKQEFTQMVIERTQEACEVRRNGTFGCWSQAVIRRGDGVHGVFAGVDPVTQCIRILYEDQSVSCALPEVGFEIIDAPGIANRIFNLQDQE